MIFVVPLELKKGILVCLAVMNCMNSCLFSQPLYALFWLAFLALYSSPFLCSLSLCLVSPAFSPPPQQASYAASSFSSVSYCVQQPKVPFTPEDCGATQGLTMSVSNSFLSRHSSFPVHSVSSLRSGTRGCCLIADHLCANSVLALSGEGEGSCGGF